jgi:nicotinate-nucleotide adenylyltransferase
MPDFRNKKIAIFGGSFNPIHLGHLLTGLEVIEKLKYDYIVYIPANIPAHKKEYNIESSKRRFDMVKMAVKSCDKFLASDVEIKRGGVSFTIDTVCQLKEIYQTKYKFGIIFGDDLLDELESWKDFGNLVKISDLICLTRNKNKIKKPKIRINYLNNRVVEMSSTEIRNRVKNKLNIDFMVTNEVKKYIIKNKLFSRTN